MIVSSAANCTATSRQSENDSCCCWTLSENLKFETFLNFLKKSCEKGKLTSRKKVFEEKWVVTPGLVTSGKCRNETFSSLREIWAWNGDEVLSFQIVSGGQSFHHNFRFDSFARCWYTNPKTFISVPRRRKKRLRSSSEIVSRIYEPVTRSKALTLCMPGYFKRLKVITRTTQRTQKALHHIPLRHVVADFLCFRWNFS